MLVKGTVSAKGKQSRAIKYAIYHKVLPIGLPTTACIGVGKSGSGIHIAQSWSTQIPGG